MDTAETWHVSISSKRKVLGSALKEMEAFKLEQSDIPLIIRLVENPKYEDPMPLLKSLAYQQFTPEEFANGTAVSILKESKIL